MNLKRLEVFLEFLIFGIMMNLVENLIILALIIKEPITWTMILISVLVIIPFAVIGEYIVDKTNLINTEKKK